MCVCVCVTLIYMHRIIWRRTTLLVEI